MRGGQCQQRNVACPPPCRTEKGCPKGTPEESNELTDENLECYEHYLMCRETFSFPDDGQVKRNSVVIRQVLDEKEMHDKLLFKQMDSTERML